MTPMVPPQQTSHPHPHLMNRFPLVLYSVLQDALTDPELAEIISWELSGTAFRIHDQKACVEKVFPRYFPGMKSYCSLRRQLNLYGILIQSYYEPSRTFSFHNGSPTENARKNDALLHRVVSSSGVYSHPFLRQDRLDLAARIPRTIIPRRTSIPTPPRPPPRESHFGGRPFFIKDSPATSTTTQNTTAATPTIAGTSLYDALSSDFPSSLADYHYPDKYNSYKNNDDIITTTSTTPTSSTSTRVIASCPDTKNSMTCLLPNVILLPFDHDAKPTSARLSSSPINGCARNLRLDDQQQEFFFHPSTSCRYGNTDVVIPSSTVVSIHADDQDDVLTTWINHDDPSQRGISCLIQQQDQHQHQKSFSLLLRHSPDKNIQHDEDIRLEIIQTFL